MAGKWEGSPEFGEKTLGSSVFDGKSSGSKRDPTRTHLGGYRSSGRPRERRATQTAGGGVCCKFGDRYWLNQNTRERKRELGDLVGTL